MATTEKKSRLDSLQKELITLKANLIGLNSNLQELHAMVVTGHQITRNLDGYEESLEKVKELAAQNVEQAKESNENVGN
jgi:multidrug resistance efflux pump